MKKIITLLLLLLINGMSWAQTAANTVEMADEWRKDGKIYVVIAVISLVFIGVILHLFSLERRIKKLEQGNK